MEVPHGREERRPTLVIVMGVSGCGKSTVGYTVAGAFQTPFKDGDELHPKSNVDKMSRGEPLDDEDRWPWLALVRQWGIDTLESDPQAKQAGLAVTTCSSLKQSYRNLLRDSKLRTIFIYLHGSDDTLTERMSNRGGHFFKLDMLRSQLNTLESPEGENDVFTIEIDDTPAKVCARAVETLKEVL